MARNENKTEKRDARRLAAHLDVAYAHALRLLREQRYVVRNGEVEEGLNYDPSRPI